MRGHVRHRGGSSSGSWEYIVDVGLAAAQRCESCHARCWIERRPKESCPRCGAALTETEERRRETKAGFGTRKACVAAMNKLLVAVEQQSYSAPTKASVREFLTKEWLPAVKATIRPSTYNSYVQHVECHIAPHIGAVKLAKLTGSQVNALYAKLAESGKKDGKTGLSAMTVHHVHSCLHKACKDAVRWGHLPKNPLDAADPPRKKSDGTKEMQTWSKEQLRAFLGSVRADRLSPLWHLIAMTGMRRGEALGLRWSDVDLENARLSVRRALIPTNRDVVVSEPKTAKGRRVIALDPATVEVLKAQATRQLEEQTSSEDWVDTGFVFTVENGATLDPESVSRYFRQAVQKALLPPIRLHDLRHTHATLALQAGIHPKVVSERLGHATVGVTLDTYSHAIPAMQEEAAQLIAQLVFAEVALPAATA
jgi:integrase